MNFALSLVLGCLAGFSSAESLNNVHPAYDSISVLERNSQAMLQSPQQFGPEESVAPAYFYDGDGGGYYCSDHYCGFYRSSCCGSTCCPSEFQCCQHDKSICVSCPQQHNDDNFNTSIDDDVFYNWECGGYMCYYQGGSTKPNGCCGTACCYGEGFCCSSGSCVECPNKADDNVDDNNAGNKAGDNAPPIPVGIIVAITLTCVCVCVLILSVLWLIARCVRGGQQSPLQRTNIKRSAVRMQTMQTGPPADTSSERSPHHGQNHGQEHHQQPVAQFGQQQYAPQQYAQQQHAPQQQNAQHQYALHQYAQQQYAQQQHAPQQQYAQHQYAQQQYAQQQYRPIMQVPHGHHFVNMARPQSVVAGYPTTSLFSMSTPTRQMYEAVPTQLN